MNQQNNNLGALLIAEIGSVTTRVTLADMVEGEMRLISQVQYPSTIEPPHRDATIAILEAAEQIGEVTNRTLVHNGELLMPQTPERDGVNHVIATTSAAGNLAIIITAVASDVSARSALHASHTTYSTVLQVVTLDSAVVTPGGRSTTSWIERQIESLLVLKPDVALIAGGLEGGPEDSLRRLAQMVSFTALHAAHASFQGSAQATSSEGTEAEQPEERMVAIYAGNSSARMAVRDALAGNVKTILVENIRPSLEQERLDEARQVLDSLYDQRILPELPGMAALQSRTSTPVSTTCKMEGLMTRFLAERYQRQVLTLNAGSTSSSAFLASPGSYHPAVLGLCGTGYGLSTLLRDGESERITRWLPFAMNETDLRHWLLNKLLRPHLIPVTREELLLEHAVTREILGEVLATLRDECPTLEYDMVVAGGGVLANAPPGLAALTILDALQPGGTHGTVHNAPLALDMHLDTLSLLAACGVLSTMNADAAVTMFERDLLQNIPMGTCVVALGGGRPGKVALEAELTQTSQRKGVVNRGTQRLHVHHGQIAHIPLDQGARAQLTLRPASGVRIGRNPSGAEVKSEMSAISGSALGVIIDARGRPLPLAEHPTERYTQLWEWLAALDVVPRQKPAPTMPTTVPGIGMPTPAPAAASNDVATAAPAASAPPRNEVAPAEEELPRLEEALQGEQQPASKRIALSDMVAEQPATTQPAPASDTNTTAGTEGQPPASKRISLSDIAVEPPPSLTPEKQPTPQPAQTETLEHDLSSLRETVEPEQKRRWFGRKKK
jgi:hypothetical protein